MYDLMMAAAPLIPTPPPATFGGGVNIGTTTVAGVSALCTGVALMVLKQGADDKWASKFSPEVMMGLGFSAASFYETAGWSGPAGFIQAIAAGPGAAWGWGILAMLVTAFALLRKHKKLRATVVGFTAAVLFAAAGGWWAWPQWMIRAAAEQAGLV